MTGGGGLICGPDCELSLSESATSFEVFKGGAGGGAIFLGGVGGLADSGSRDTRLSAGGSGSLIGSLVGGLILGVAETFAGFFLGAHWSLAVAFFALVLVLLLKPEGLFKHV